MMADPGKFSTVEARPVTEGEAVDSPDLHYEVEESRIPLMARVLMADVALAVVALVVFVIIGLQRLDGPTLDDRRAAYYEDVVVFFAVGAVFALVAFLLYRSRHVKVALVQVAVALLAFGLGGYAAASGSPSAGSVVAPVAPEEPSPNG
jgi:hypothetical protein